MAGKTFNEYTLKPGGLIGGELIPIQEADGTESYVTTPNELNSRVLHNDRSDVNTGDYQHLTADELAKTQALHTLTNLKVWMGNASNEPAEAITVDIDDVDSATTTYLNTESNWFSGGNPVNSVTAPGGVRGQRWYNADYMFVCTQDLQWIRTLRKVAAVNIYGIPLTEKAKLENAANWTGNVYTGTALVNCLQGMKHFSANYFYEIVDLNTPIRMARV